MVHRYKSNGYNIIIDSNSGAVHSVDELAYDVIGLYEERSKEEIVAEMLVKYKDDPEVTEEELLGLLEDIEGLIEEGKLFSSDPYASIAGEFKDRQAVVKALCLHIAHDCNLACKYCFAGKGEYQGGRALMSLEVGKAALDFLVKNSEDRHNLEIDFFGGEPLMNFEVVKDIVKYGRELEKIHDKNFRFTLTTNGVLLDDEIIEFANREMSNVVLSLDGRREVHDRLRVNRGGKGSYDLILPKFYSLAEKRGQKDYYVRGTFTGYNPDFAEDILHIADLGFEEVSMEPVVCSPDEPYAIRKEQLPELFSQYEYLAKEMLKRKEEGKGFNFFHFDIDLEGGPCIVKRVSGCGVGTEYMAVTPTGELYPCHQFVGDESFVLGNVFEGITNQEKIDFFKACNVYTKDECKDCFAKLYCSGGCAANSYNSTGSINGRYEIGCELHKKRIECAIMMKVAEADM